MNRQFLRFAAIFCLILALAACSKKDKGSGEEVYGISESDSIAIIDHTNRIMDLLKENNIDEAAKNLYTFDFTDSTATLVGEKTIKELQMRSRVFPVVNYSIYETDFREPLHNAVVYNVAFGPESPETGEAPMTKMAFNIINLDGKFYVTIMDNPGTHSTTKRTDNQ